ncbi:MAG TPA: ABC transporter transmembrane domain-containing protein, partial [Stellaceae bacterium]|nr:ABC transporter transmembrane domain-containing protein [Stellaceae bacterium]
MSARAPLARLLPIARFLLPYHLRLMGAGLALIIASATILVLGQGLRRLVDIGFAESSNLDGVVVGLLAIVVVLACSTYVRFYLVSWLGERVVADLRRAVFDRIIALSPGYFEATQTGELMSRLTTDTTLLQTVIGSSVSMALRNVLILLGSIVMLVVTSAKLTLLMVIVVPAVVIP